MDPLHLTEFASDRFYEKLSQSRDATGNLLQERTVPEGSIAQSPFILPLRASHSTEIEEPTTKHSDLKGKEKRSGFLRFGPKILHSKALSASSAEQGETRASVGGEPARQSLAFDQLFLHLPNELQVQIICSLPLTDVLNLRLASRPLHALVMLNEAPIVRHHLDRHVPVYARRIYPAPENTPLTFHYLCGIWHRLHVAAKLSDLMCEWITKEIFLKTTEEKKAEFASHRERMRRRLIPLLFTIFHFFETYRDLHLKYIQEHGHGLLREPHTLNPIEVKIMNMYDDQTLLRVHQVFPLIISSFCRRLRPPSYVGRVERSLRGYLREKPPDEVHVAALCIGGLRQVERFWEVKGYNTRRAAVDVWYDSIAKVPIVPESKKRRGLMGLGRKKSTMAMAKQAAAGATHDAQLGWRGSGDAFPPLPTGNHSDSLVFNTSLAAGMPMGPLSMDQLKSLLSDLPKLQEIWSKTAEALILDRKIVERSSDIRRNGQVLLELIREDGIEEEDQWWYGTAAPESVRPNLEAIQEDALE